MSKMDSRCLWPGRDDSAGPWPSWGNWGAWGWPQHQRTKGTVTKTYKEKRNLPAAHVCWLISGPGREMLRLHSVRTQCSEVRWTPFL